MNENQFAVVKECEFDKPDIHMIYSIFDKIIRDCHKKNFHIFEYRCEYGIKFLNNKTMKHLV